LNEIPLEEVVSHIRIVLWPLMERRAAHPPGLRRHAPPLGGGVVCRSDGQEGKAKELERKANALWKQ
jgi:hypothetical protein